MAHPKKTHFEQQLRDELKCKMGSRPYSMWFANTGVQCSDHSIDIQAATPLAAGWIQEKFSSTLKDAAKSAYGRDVEISISVQPQEEGDSPESRRTTRATMPSKKKTFCKQLLSFDEYVVGSCNALAFTAAKQMTHPEGKSISPLFIHGACGVGKTHLLQAICRCAAQSSPDSVRYITAEQFTNEFIASSRSGEFARFRNRYRTVDLLAIDDVHFVASKMKTQEELLHTLDAAGLRGSRLVLASDEDPRQIKRLNHSLANRFVAGMIAEIGRPDRETRTQIIEMLIAKHGLRVSEGAINHLASHAIGSVREIEGAVTRLKATASLFMKHGDSVGIEAVERILRTTPQTACKIRIVDVVDCVCRRGGITSCELRGRSRSTTIVFWRSVASYLGRQLTAHSYPELAIAMGRKNHSTVHAAVKRISQELQQQNPNMTLGCETYDLRELVDQLTWTIRSRANKSASNQRARKDPSAR